jgi:S-DNA-T family DNA segregation ATPase FtsK/SpoIIIE
MSDIADMPHLLIAGTTGAGKSVLIHSLIISLIYRINPEDLKILLVDTKAVELTAYGGMPHLLADVVTSAEAAVDALAWAVGEMERRYKLIGTNRNIDGYNANHAANKLPRVVIIVEEFAELVELSKGKVESYITRLSQAARGAGIHLILATQRPSVKVVTGVIKANIPVRIALAVKSNIDSRCILDHGGAELLTGKGDMLYSQGSKETRLQGAYVDAEEVTRVMSHIRATGAEHVAEAEERFNAAMENRREQTERDAIDEVAEYVIATGTASVNDIKKRFNLGYNKASEYMEQLEQMGVVGESKNGKPRDILIDPEEWNNGNQATD